jgi:hypothetical protein
MCYAKRLKDTLADRLEIYEQANNLGLQSITIKAFAKFNHD